MEATLREILLEAYKSRKAVMQFNFRTLEEIEVFIEAGNETSNPIILGCIPKIFNILGGRNIVGVYRSLASTCKVPVVLHLDHATNLEDIWKAMSTGFTSVMIDGSRLPLDENIKITSTVVRVARPAGLSIEGELGIIGRTGTLEETNLEDFTTPEEAQRFVAETEVDALAIAVGSVHGFYKSTPKLAFDRIDIISRITNIPLVLHGGTGIPISDLKKAIHLGITKVNIGTEFRDLVIRSYRELSQSADDIVDVVKIVKERLKYRAMEILTEINTQN